VQDLRDPDVNEAGGLRLEVGDLTSEVGDPKSEVGDPKSEVGDPKLEVGERRSPGIPPNLTPGSEAVRIDPIRYLAGCSRPYVIYFMLLWHDITYLC